jgi:hypothetical protein
MLLREAARTRTSARSIWPDLDEDARRDLLARIESECAEWHALPAPSAPSPLAEPVRAAFWEWFSPCPAGPAGRPARLRGGGGNHAPCPARPRRRVPA